MCKLSKLCLGLGLALLYTLIGPLLGHAQSLSLIDDMNFGITDVANNPPGGTVQMGPDAAITYGSNLNGTGTGVAGKVQLTGTTGQGIEIRCSSSATLAKAGGGSFNLTPVKASFTTAQTYATATDCNGAGVTVINGTLSANATDNIAYFGGQLDVGASTVQGMYDTSTMGGTPLTITVIFN
jgi:hypothetical protein